MKLGIKISGLTLLTIILVLVWRSWSVSFLSSSIIQASLEHADAPEDIVPHIRLEHTQLQWDKKQAIEDKNILETKIADIQNEKQATQAELDRIQKNLDEINASIVAFPWPDIITIEQSYDKKIAEENARYEKQKIADQKLYADTINLINQTYEETIRLNKGEDDARMQDAHNLAVTNRKNALQSLTNIQIEHLEKHESNIQIIHDEKQKDIEKAQTENDALLLPLIQKKNTLAEQKIDLQYKWEKNMAEESHYRVELEKTIQSIQAIEDDIAAIEYRIFILEENILNSITV